MGKWEDIRKEVVKIGPAAVGGKREAFGRLEVRGWRQGRRWEAIRKEVKKLGRLEGGQR